MVFSPADLIHPDHFPPSLIFSKHIFHRSSGFMFYKFANSDASDR